MEPFKVLRMNQEEIHLAGPEGHGDVRIVNSYPSKIGKKNHYVAVLVLRVPRIIRIYDT